MSYLLFWNLATRPVHDFSIGYCWCSLVWREGSRGQCSLTPGFSKRISPHGIWARYQTVGNTYWYPGWGRINLIRQKTGVAPTVNVENSTIPSARQAIEEHGRAFLTSAPYMRKTLFACDRFRRMHPNDTFERVTPSVRYPVCIRPLYASLLSNVWPIASPTIKLACQLTVGAASPLAGDIAHFPSPIILGSATLTKSAAAPLANWPAWGVITYVYPYSETGLELLKGYWIQPWSTE